MATQAPAVNLVTPSMTNTMPDRETLVVSIGGSCPSRPATGTNRVGSRGASLAGPAVDTMTIITDD
jgi:hypothetical protein